MSKIKCDDCLDTGRLYPFGAEHPWKACPFCDHGVIESKITYHKARIIPLDEGTTVYWVCNNSIAKDILHSDIPEGANVIDETHNKGKMEFMA